MREEMKQYGEMLARFDDLNKSKDTVIRHDRSKAVQAQIEVIRAIRRRRREFERQLAGRFGLPNGSTFAQIIELVPPEYCLMIEALREETSALPKRIQQRVSREENLLRIFAGNTQGVRELCDGVQYTGRLHSHHPF